MAEYEIKEGVGIIPAGSTEIKDEAFKGCEELKSVVIPDTVTKIGSHAFRWCSALTEINIPDSVTEIGRGAFAGCISLKNLVLPDSVTEIGSDAFQACINLTDIVISESVISIGSGAFSSIRDLTSITVAAGNKVYDSRDNCNAIIETKTNTLIASCKNTVIPATVTRIGSEAFLGCCGLADLVIPESVTEIESCAFHGASLTSVVISAKVKEIGEWAFRDCSALTDVVIGDHVKKIGDYAFFECPNLTNLLIGKSVVKIGESAFGGCSNLTRLVIGNSVTKIAESAFSKCSGLTSVTLPDSLTKIGDFVFSGCTGLTSVTIPNSVTVIAYGAFEGCIGLTDVTIPVSVTTIGVRAFAGCTGLMDISIPNSVTEICWLAFNGCTGLTSITIPDSVTKIGSTVFLNCTNLKEVIIPNSVTEIGDRAFMGCTGLTSIVLPDSVTKIAEYSFCGCTSLENIVIPNSVTEIGRYAFKGCTSLNTITLPESVTDIAFYSSPFEDCTALKTIYVPANKYGHFKKLLPKDLHELIVRLPKPKKPKKKPDDVKVNCIKPVNGTSSFDLENNRSEEYSLIINKVLSLTEKVVSQLRAEKKNTGKFSDLVTIHDGDYEFQFNVYALGKISVNMTFYVDINRGNETIMHCEVRYIKSNLDLSRYYYNYNDKFKMWALACDMSRVKPLIQSGDTICIDNNGKAAYAKVEILSEQSCTRKLRLTKELGHTETLAYESGYPPEITTYVADESTEEYFGGKDSLEKDLRFFIDDEVVFHGDLCWYVNTHERIGYDSEVQLITPLTENDVVLNRKKEALEKLLDNCQAEFCYGDSRVEKYKKDYMILGEENIATIYKVYMHWLRMNCSTELQEGSDDFVGVAIDWRGREDLQPTFDVSGDVVVVNNDHPAAGNPITNAQEFLDATSGERNEYLMAHFAKVFPQAHIDKIVCVLNDGDEIFYDLYTDGMKSAVTVIIEDDELDIVSTLELVMKSKNSTYEEMLEKHNNNNK